MIRRRQIVQFMVASTVAGACGTLTKKALAQQEEVSSPSQGMSPLLYGVRDVSDRVILQSLNLTTLNPQDLSAGIPEIALQPNERLSGFTMLLNGSFIIATAPAVTSIVGQSNPSRLILISFAYPQILPTLQLQPNNVVESLLATNDGELLSIISLSQGIPPFRLAKINYQTGEVSFIDELPLPPNRRFSNLAQSADGLIYATSISPEGPTMLVQLDLLQGNLISLSKLTFNNIFLQNDLASLAFSSLGQLFALGDPTSKKTNSLFSVDKGTGEMELVTDFSQDKIVFARS